MFGFLKNLFGAIFGFLGLGKKSEYAVEFEPSAPASKPAAAEPAKAEAAPAAKPAAATVAPAAKPAAAPAAPAKPKAEPAKPAAPLSGFASNYLVTAGSGSRRRPGANMNSYLDMARQVYSRG